MWYSLVTLRIPPAQGFPARWYCQSSQGFPARWYSQFSQGLPASLCFDDHKTVFRHRTTAELVRALLVLSVCASDWLVDNSLQMFRAAHRTLGVGVLNRVLGPTVYSQFVAGKEEAQLAAVARAVQGAGLRLMVAPTLEEDVGESTHRQHKYDNNAEQLVQLARCTNRHGGDSPCLQLKLSALLAADTLCKLSHIYNNAGKSRIQLVGAIADAIITGADAHIIGLNKEDSKNLRLALRRLYTLGQVVSSSSVRLLVDAEYSYINPACNLLTTAMMCVYNSERPVVCNTYQCYFKDALQSYTEDVNLARALGVAFGAKLVRGAYLERERSVSVERVCMCYRHTGDNYVRVLETALQHAARNGTRSFLAVATHNEDAVRFAAKRLGELDIDRRAGHVVFAQIYGMGEYISVPLAHAHYIVYKSVPTGTLVQVLPYLARRLAENRSVLKGARRERELLWKELRWRMLGWL